jgi:hypothetical protein
MRKKIVWKKDKRHGGLLGYIGIIRCFYISDRLGNKAYIMSDFLDPANLLGNSRIFKTVVQAKAKADEIADYIFSEMRES